MQLRRFFTYLLAIIIIITPLVRVVNADTAELTLYACSAVLIDADNNRILYGKDENQVMPMASTTKIMTLVIALENGEMDDIVTISPYAASQPDVQLNMKAGEQYYLKDLLYGMMLRSYNDVAVAVAEYIGDCAVNFSQTGVADRDADISRRYVQVFADMMNEKARELGCTNTYFITPNGLDAQDEKGIHSTTAYELAVIAAYAIKNQTVTQICTTKSYSFDELAGKRHADVTTTDRFLDMFPGAVGLKTGFTGDAGYCFVGAIKQEDRSFVSVVLASGWPPNKAYKWTDTRKLMELGTGKYYNKTVLCPNNNFSVVQVADGKKTGVDTYYDESLTMLLSEEEQVRVVYNMPECVRAPVKKDQEIGQVMVYIDEKLYAVYPIKASKAVAATDYLWFLRKTVGYLLL